MSAFANAVRIPIRSDKVFKDECFYSFDTPVTLSFYLVGPDYGVMKGLSDYVWVLC